MEEGKIAEIDSNNCEINFPSNRKSAMTRCSMCFGEGEDICPYGLIHWQGFIDH